MTKYSVAYRTAAQTNLDNLGHTRMLLEEQIRQVEVDAANAKAEALTKLRREHSDALAAALAPLEEQLNDINLSIYSQERVVGALPAAPAATFSDRSEDDRQQTEQETDQPAGDAEAPPAAETGKAA